MPKQKNNNLTDKEIEIIKLIACDLKSREIAEKSGLSLKTVEVHRHNIFKKTGVKTAAGLMIWAIENGYLPKYTIKK